MPAHPTVLSWVDENKEFSDQYARARELGYQGLADELLDIADDGRNDKFRDDDGHVTVDHDVIARSRLRVDTRKWLLSKMLPKVYGDRQTHEHTGADGGPIHMLTEIDRAARIAGLLGRAVKRKEGTDA
jgi:hypothetical protein